MPNTYFTKQELYTLRNSIPVDKVIEKLRIPFKIAEGYTRFRCPVCKEFNTAVNPKTNLARCFLCKKNYNTIDIVIKVQRLSFINSVKLLQKFNIQPNQSLAPVQSANYTRTEQKSPVTIGSILENMNLQKLSKPKAASQKNVNLNQLIERIIKLEREVQSLSSKIITIEKK